MDLQDYLRILRTHATVIVVATVVGALFGGLLGFINRPEDSDPDRAPYLASIDLTLLSEQGRRALAERLGELTTSTARAELSVESPSEDLSLVDYAQRLMSDEVLNDAAQTLGRQTETLNGRIEATANSETITVSISQVGPDAAREELAATVQAFREAVRTGDEMAASTRILIDTQTPNADLQTSPGYTQSRMPTYAALATSDVVLKSAAGKTGLGIEDLRSVVNVRAEPNTTILTIGVTDAPSSTTPTQILTALEDALKDAIPLVESTPVAFQDLGSSIQDTGTVVRTLAVTVDQPEIVTGNSGTIPAATIASTLTSLAGEVPATLATSVTGITEPTGDDELVNTDSTSITIARLSEIEGADDSSLNAASIRLTTGGSTPEEAKALAESTAATLSRRAETNTDPEPWPLQLVPGSLVATSELIQTAAAEDSQPADHTTTNVILGLLIGLALGIGYAFLMSSRDKTIYGPRQLVEATGEPAFGVIPISDNSDSWAALTEHDLGGEGYRALRSNVLLGLNDAKVIGLVSPDSGTGTHTVGVNLAISLTQAGSNVCLVETALSQPRLAELLQVNSSPGLAEAATSSNVSASIQRSDNLGFDVITAGLAMDDVTATLMSSGLQETIEYLRERYDTVLLLCAPAVESSEASAVTPLGDATLILIRVGATSMTNLEIAARVLLQVNTNIAGIVANCVPPQRADEWRRYLPLGVSQPEAVL